MSQQQLKRHKVLIVEDEPNERVGLAELVSSWGYRVEVANDGVEGLKKTETWVPSIIVADMKMPRIGGLEMLERLRGSQRTVPFIIVTAQGTIDSAVRAMQMGAHEYITKPIDTNRLKTILYNAASLVDRSSRDPFPLWNKFDGDLLYYPQIIPITADFAQLLSETVRNPLELLRLQPRQFEELVAELWHRFGYDIELTAQTRDRGYDVVAVKHAEVNIRFLIECKRYDPNRKVGVELVRQLHGVKMHEKATKGILATTSSFSAPARTFFANHVWELEARDYHGVVEWVRLASENKSL
jgi:CheY-like chemotaxis protein